MSKSLKDHFPLPEFGAFIDVSAANDFIEEHTGKKDYIKLPEGNDGVTTMLEDEKNNMVAVVCLNGELMKESTPRYRLGTLVHECSHIADRYFVSIGEGVPSDEFNAYMHEAFFSAAVEQIGLEWFTTPLQPKPKNQKKTD